MYPDEKKFGEVHLEPWRLMLLAAADYMEEHGHCKHTLEQPNGAVCVVGATNRVGGFGSQCVDRVAAYLGLPDAKGVARWNNADERTGAEVIRAMREAAISA